MNRFLPLSLSLYPLPFLFAAGKPKLTLDEFFKAVSSGAHQTP
jgi:hypothetical protein